MSRRILFITGNKNKLREVQEILSKEGNTPFRIEQQAVDVPEVQGTTQQVALAKVKAAAEATGSEVITEDTALSFDAFGGLPGPYIKDFVANVGCDHLSTLLEGFADKSATAICTFAYSPGPGKGEPILFEGKTRGSIVPSRGSRNFGWDAAFQPENSDKTYAEMEPEEKNAISHRYRAFDKLRNFLMNQETEN